MGFEEKKKATIIKMETGDKSKKGSVDADIKLLVERINKSDDFYTTSSCSGRIVLMNKKGKRKDMNDWLLAEHTTITSEQYETAMSSEGKEEVWMMQEAPIMHICARDMHNAEHFMEVCRTAGFKRATIISVTPRIIIELLGSEKMETVIFAEGQNFVSEEYRDTLIKHANDKLTKSKAKLKRLEDLAKDL